MKRFVITAAVLAAVSMGFGVEAAPFSTSLAKAISRGTGMSLPDAKRMVNSYNGQGAELRRADGHDKALITPSGGRFDVVVCNFTKQTASIDLAPDTPRRRLVDPRTCAPFANIAGLGATGAGPNYDKDWNGAFLYRRSTGS